MSKLMPSERICLKRTRDQLVRLMDVADVLPLLRGQAMFTNQEEAQIMAETRRRERVIIFLDALEKKDSASFKAFSSALSECNPHLYLILSEWDKDDHQQLSAAAHGNPIASVSDEWDLINRSRGYLLSQIDGAEMVPMLDSAGLLTSDQKRMILEDPVRERRSQALLDLLEMQSSEAYEVFIGAIGDLYPHVFLELTQPGGGDDDW